MKAKLKNPTKGPKVRTYLVTWEMHLNATTPREAAERALEIHRDPESIATHFVVSDRKGNYTEIDLELSPNEPPL